jgi:hypothetical protein
VNFNIAALYRAGVARFSGVKMILAGFSFGNQAFFGDHISLGGRFVGFDFWHKYDANLRMGANDAKTANTALVYEIY